jgi:hypothetical protein
MFVKLSITGQVTLGDRDNFRAFKLVIDGDPARLDQVKRALANIAEAVALFLEDADLSELSEVSEARVNRVVVPGA